MTAAPPLASSLSLDGLSAFDYEGLRTFLDPSDGGVDPQTLGLALGDSPRELVSRVRAALPPPCRDAFDAGRSAADDRSRTDARRAVVDQLFWPLVYWTRPDDYEELIAGEEIAPELLSALEVDRAVVCDIGAGTGRFTLMVSARAQRVIAVDATPTLLERLQRKAEARVARNVELRRGSFAALPLESASVDLAVACSSFTTTGPHGGEQALAEAERIVRPGGAVAIIWPQQPEWLTARGYVTVTRGASDGAVRFRDAATAERLCAMYHSEKAARWVRAHAGSAVPYSVLGLTAPNHMCVKRMVTPSP